jgi:hypothetical protein
MWNMWHREGRIRTGRNVEGNGYGLIEGTVPVFARRVWRTSPKTSVRIAGLGGRYFTSEYKGGVTTAVFRMNVVRCASCIIERIKEHHSIWWRQSGRNSIMRVCMYMCACVLACLHVCTNYYACVCISACMCMYVCVRACMCLRNYYVCMYVFMCICVHACVLACICVLIIIHVCMYVCMHACVYVCMYIYVRACMCVCNYACMSACVYVCVRACVRACMCV